MVMTSSSKCASLHSLPAYILSSALNTPIHSQSLWKSWENSQLRGAFLKWNWSLDNFRATWPWGWHWWDKGLMGTTQTMKITITMIVTMMVIMRIRMKMRMRMKMKLMGEATVGHDDPDTSWPAISATGFHTPLLHYSFPVFLLPSSSFPSLAHLDNTLQVLSCSVHALNIP